MPAATAPLICEMRGVGMAPVTEPDVQQSLLMDLQAIYGLPNRNVVH